MFFCLNHPCNCVIFGKISSGKSNFCMNLIAKNSISENIFIVIILMINMNG